MPAQRRRRREDEEARKIEQQEQVSLEETGLSEFLDGLGPEGISEVSLYRVLPTKKQEFVTSGPPSQFSEQYVQVTYGGGDYMVRSKLDGRWFRSKSFS